MRSLAVILVIGVFAQQTFAEEPEAIVGGTPAAPGEFPWQCSLQCYGSHICGCSIIGNKTILTAAHCINKILVTLGLFPFFCHVRSGSIRLNEGHVNHIESVKVNENYDSRKIQNDVAVITVKEAIQLNNYTQIIKLAESPPNASLECQLSGWGLTRPNGNPSPHLLKMTQHVVDQEKCQQELEDVGTITDKNVCALNQRGIGACQGDSGGPFVCKVDEDTYHQYGITSWGIPCGKGYPDVYTNVHTLRNFIDSVKSA